VESFLSLCFLYESLFQAHRIHHSPGHTGSTARAISTTPLGHPASHSDRVQDNIRRRTETCTLPTDRRGKRECTPINPHQTPNTTTSYHIHHIQTRPPCTLTTLCTVAARYKLTGLSFRAMIYY